MADEDEGPAIRLVPSRDPNTPRASDGLSGNPFGKPTDNPFATAPSSDEGGSNPFANQPGPGTSNPFGTAPASNPFNPPSGEGAAPSSNPFATPASDPGGSPFGTAPTSNPFGAPADSGSLDLDRPAPASAGGNSKAELDEWNRSMTTGEFTLQGDAHGGDRSKAITGEMKRPSDAQLQAAQLPPEGAAGAGFQQRPTSAAEAGGGSGGKLIALGLGGLVVLVAIALGGKIVYAKMTKKAPSVVESRSTETDAFVRRMQADAENAPDCWTTDDGYSFVYKNEAGEMVKVETVAEVPVLYRKNSVCVPD